MKRVVSVSLGSSKRDHVVEIEIAGEKILIERRGTDGDTKRFMELCAELDGKIDAIGYGGMTETIKVGKKVYPLKSAQKLVAHVKHTPVVDGSGLKDNLERQMIEDLKKIWGDVLTDCKVLLTVGVDRYGLAAALDEEKCDVVYGDMMFSLGISIPIRSIKGLSRMAAILMPIVGNLPVSMLYPTGTKQNVIEPKFVKYYHWADVIAGDFNYIKRYMPEQLENKIILTNTTTAEDVELLKARGVAYLLTTTPVLGGRTFGTNVMEGVLQAVSGLKTKITEADCDRLVKELGWKPTVRYLKENQT